MGGVGFSFSLLGLGPFTENAAHKRSFPIVVTPSPIGGLGESDHRPSDWLYKSSPFGGKVQKRRPTPAVGLPALQISW